tara:strand:+ start:923 stop:1372 length:450 start_codon:yes stop_codon:yes gene_type:complete
MAIAGVKINAQDLAMLNKKLKKLKKFSEQKFSNEIGYTAADIISKATSKVPVDTGNLKQSLSYGSQKNQAYVEANAKYAPYVEFGTGGSISTTDAQELGISSSMIKTMFKGQGKREVNMKPQPYFFNSVREGFNALLMRLNKEIKKDIK